jgi:hypothetical protein
LTLVYSAPAAVYLAWSAWKPAFKRRIPVSLALVLAGFFVGALPWWVYGLSRGPSLLVLELLGTAVSVETSPWWIRIGDHLLNFVLLGTTALFGFRPPWKVEWLALPLLPFVLIFWMGVLAFFERSVRAGMAHRAEYGVLAGVVGVTTAGFLFTSFGVDPSGRYFLPMVVPLGLAAAGMILTVRRFKLQPVLLVVLLISYHVWGTLQCAFQFPPGLTTQFYEPSIVDHRAAPELVRFLKQEGELRGYSNYWVSYPLTFLSGEEMVYVPRLPYHLDLRYTPRDDRYAPYTAQVADSERVAYITTRNPALDRYLVEQFTALGVSWQEKQIGDYHVYFHLSQPVRPEQMELGVLRK